MVLSHFLPFVKRMLAATNSSHPASTPTPTTAPAPAPHVPSLPPNITQLPQPPVHSPYHGVPHPQPISQSFYPPQVPLHPSSTAPPPQQQQQPLPYYGIPQLPPQQQQAPPVSSAGAIDSIDPSQKVSPLDRACLLLGYENNRTHPRRCFSKFFV